MNTEHYVRYGMCLLLLAYCAVTGCATTPAATAPPLAQKTLEPPVELQELFISQPEEAEKEEVFPKTPEKRFSFSLNNAAIQDTLLALSKESGFNVVVDPDVAGTVTIDLKRVTAQEVLDALLVPLGLDYTIKGNFIRVLKPKMETRIFTLNYTTTKRKGSGELTVSGGVAETGSDGGSSGGSSRGGSGGGSGGEGGEEESKSSIETESETDLWADIQNALESIIFPGNEEDGTEGSRVGGGWSRVDAEGRRIVGNPLSGTIMITALPQQLAKAAEFLEAVEGSVHRQVFIHAQIMEITLDDAFEMGINWGYVTDSSKVTGTLPPWGIPPGVDNPSVLQNLSPDLGVFQIGIANDSFNLLIDGLAREGQVNMLSSPRLCTLNNQKAMIKVGREDVFFEITTETQFLDGGSQVIQSSEAQTVTIGVMLDVTPQISSDGTITMDIHPSVSELAGEAVSRLGDTAPIIDVREVSTIIRVKEGETIVLGGLIKDRKEEEIQSIPFLGDIPYLGSLFRHTRQRTTKTELVITLTPTVMIGKTIDAFTQERMASFEQSKKGFHLGGRPWQYGVEGEKVY